MLQPGCQVALQSTEYQRGPFSLSNAEHSNHPLPPAARPPPPVKPLPCEVRTWSLLFCGVAAAPCAEYIGYSVSTRVGARAAVGKKIYPMGRRSSFWETQRRRFLTESSLFYFILFVFLKVTVNYSYFRFFAFFIYRRTRDWFLSRPLRSHTHSAFFGRQVNERK